MPTIIIIGAASGMGKALALHYVKQKIIVAVVDKNITALHTIFSSSIPSNLIAAIDVADSINARCQLLQLIQEMGEVDTLIYTAAITDKTGIWENELQQHNINAIGFAAMAHAIFNYFKANKIKGQIVAFSSVLAYRGLQQALPYCAGKAFIQSYMQGLRYASKANNLNITITEICPGFVQTPMISKQQNTFWITPLAKATSQIIRAIDNKKQKAFVSKRWSMIAFLLYYLPSFILHNTFLNSLLTIKTNTMKQHLKKIMGFIVFIAFTSCDPIPTSSYYIPQSRQKENIFYASPSSNIPLLQQKKSFSTSLKFTSVKKHNAVELQTAYLATKKFGLMAGYFSGTGSNIDHQNFELGIGYIPFVDSLIHTEVYGGFGTGRMYNIHATGSSNVGNTYFFVQPTIAYIRIKESIEGAVVSKFVFNKFSVKDTSFNTDKENYNKEQMDILYTQPNQFFWEPGFVLSKRFGNVKFQFGYSASINLTNKNLNSSRDNFSFGVLVKFKPTNK